MTEQEIKSKLDELANLKAASDVLALQKQGIIDTILTDEIKAKLADVDDEFSGKSEEGYVRAVALEAEIKQDILAHGASVKGAFLHAIWMKGRESWDGKLLAGFAIAHPEILTAHKVGEPSVSLRTVKA